MLHRLRPRTTPSPRPGSCPNPVKPSLRRSDLPTFRLSLSADPASSLEPPVSRTDELSIRQRTRILSERRESKDLSIGSRGTCFSEPLRSRKSDELSHMESYSYAKPPGEGVRIPPTRQSFRPAASLLATRHSPLATNSCTINTSTPSRICIKTNDFNPFGIRTYRSGNAPLKTKDFKSRRINTSAISRCKPFRISTSKKRWGRGSSYSLCLRQKSLPFATRHFPLNQGLADGEPLAE
jgi:hypothetical protein